jgi:hypothetical protein
MHGLIAQSPSGAWSAGGAILTFVLPMVLFIVVAIGLYILYTKPSIVPGRRSPGDDHPVSYTSVPGTPLATEVPGNPAPDPGDRAADGAVTTVGTKAGGSDNATTKGGKWRLRRRH